MAALRVFLGHLADLARLQEQIAEQRASCARLLADLAEVREGLDDDPAGVWRHARLVADWGLEHYGSELRSLQRLAEQTAEQLAEPPPESVAGASAPPVASRRATA